jgi:hypothetical protein
MDSTFDRQQSEDVPTWLACRTYARLNSDPVQCFTVFEAADDCSLATSIRDMYSPHRAGETESLQKWKAASLSNHMLMSFRMIFRIPD